MKNLIILFLIILSLQGFSQNKYEKETRIKESELPEKALVFVYSLAFNNKIKWYKETGINKTSFEAKTKYKGQKYSIEFSENGFFEDIEIKINKGRVPLKTFEKINKILSNENGKYSIEKIQLQYSGPPEDVLSYIKNNDTANRIIVRYEIVISTKKQGSYIMFEYLFSEAGDFIDKSKITLKSTDNLLY